MNSRLLNEFLTFEIQALHRLTLQRNFSIKYEDSKVWIYIDSSNNELILPKAKTPDYPYLLFSHIEKLNKITGKSTQQILRILQSKIEDELKIQIKHDDVRHGSIPLDDGIRLISGGRDLISASANSLITPKPYYFGKSNREVSQLVEDVRLGQTEIGSYIVNIFLDVKGHENTELFPEDYFGRKVSRKVFSNLSTLKQVIEDYQKKPEIEIFDSAVKDGISANLCKSILDFGGNESKRNVNIGISYQSDSEKNKDYSEIEFLSPQLPYVRMGYEHLVQQKNIPNHELIGYVIRLSREEDHDEGEITIAAYFEGKHRKVKAKLTLEQYENAIAAHRDQELLYILGTLIIDKRTASMVDIESVYIE